MKQNKYKLVSRVILVLMILPCLVFAQQDIPKPDIDWGMHPLDFEKVGMSGWQFLKIPSTARSVGMGGIATATSHGDASAAFTNPASMADVRGWEITMNNMTWIADIKYQSGALVGNLGKWGVIGASFIYLDAGEMERTENIELYTETGTSRGVQPVTEGLGTFSAGDLSIGLSYARQITNKLQLGGTARYVQETLADAVSGAWSVDISTMYYTGVKSLRLAFVGRNFGGDAEFVEYDAAIGVPPIKVRMPMAFLFGAAFDLFEGKGGSPYLWTVAAEFVHPNDGPEKVNVGSEFCFMNLATLRAGYRYNYDEEGITLGGGLKYETDSFNVILNYGFMDFGRLGNVKNMLSIGFGF